MHGEIVLGAILIGVAIAMTGVRCTEIIVKAMANMAPPRPVQAQMFWAWDRLYVVFWDSGEVLMSDDQGNNWQVMAVNLRPRYRGGYGG